jgi:hypothetical protein
MARGLSSGCMGSFMRGRLRRGEGRIVCKFLVINRIEFPRTRYFLALLPELTLGNDN